MRVLAFVKFALLLLLCGSAHAHLSETGPCPPGWHDGTSLNANCYFYPGAYNTMSWDEAWNYCKTLKNGSFLAEPKTMNQFNFVRSIENQPFNGDNFYTRNGHLFHLGATDAFREGKWRWIETSEEVEMGEEFWHSGQPDNYMVEGHGEHCLELWQPGDAPGKFNDVPCSGNAAMAPFIIPPLCEIAPK